jgi:regulation of enolase protein 1 (concanavalin A-like superfamily)
VYGAKGRYTARLTVRNGTLTGTSTTTVTVGTSPPTATITAPARYNAGETISFSGTATDPADGPLPGYDYGWKVDFYRNKVTDPSYYAEVAVPAYGPATGTSGSFTIPADPYQVPGSFYRITLTVTDSRGLQTVVTKDLHPNLTSFTVTANVAGAGYYVDGTWHTGTYSTQGVVGAQHVLTGMALAQVIGGTRYRFSGWADGSALTDSFTSTATAATFTASYDPVQTTTPTGWQSTDIGAPITAGTADYSTATKSFYLDGAGADEFSGAGKDQSHFVYQTLNGDGTIVARVRYQTNSDPWAKAGLMIRQSTAAGASWVDALVTGDVSPNTPNINGIGCNASGCLSSLPAITPPVGNGVREQTYTGGSSTGPTLTGYANPNKWLKLTRAGSIFTSYESTDGVHWTNIGSQTVSMTGPVDIGLFDTSHDVGQVSSVAFDNVSITPVIPPGPLPSPWTDTDVGSPAIAGSAGYTASSHLFTVNGAGTDIFGTFDQFHYVDQPLGGNGNGTLIARVTSQTNTSSNAKAGVMIKQSTTAGSSYILIAVAPSGIVKAQYDFTGSVQATSIYNFPDVWMKLVSLNGTFSAYVSGDGTTWTLLLSRTLPTPITFPATIGLFVCSHNTSQLGTATFDNVSFTPGP